MATDDLFLFCNSRPGLAVCTCPECDGCLFSTSCLGTANCTCPECDDYFYEQAMEEEARLWREQNKIIPEKPAPPAEVHACTDDLPDFKELARQRRERQAYSVQRRVRRKALRRA